MAQPAGCGDSAKWGIFASRHTQAGARDVQMSSIGANVDASSSEGKRIDVNCGLASLCVNSGVPHSAQKLLVASCPLLARTANVRGVPLTSRSAVFATTPDANGAPLERWQSWQWQFSMAMGALAHV